MGNVLRFNNHLESDFMEWQREAACLGVNELFYPGPHQNQEPAKAICRECPVRARCLDYAITKPETFGIWGGYSERERKQMRRLARERAS